MLEQRHFRENLMDVRFDRFDFHDAASRIKAVWTLDRYKLPTGLLTGGRVDRKRGSSQ